jgi:protein tyrosine/serine phosphatase
MAESRTSQRARAAAATAVDSRHLDWAGCVNVRDLGGHATQDGRWTRRGAIVRADALDALTIAGWQALAAHGVRTVVDLRTSSDRHRAPRPPVEVETRHVPVFEDAEFDEIHAVERMVDLYGRLLERCSRSFGGALAAVAHAPAGGVVVHCQVGKDRTGLACALLLSLVGVEDAAIAEDYAASEARVSTLLGTWVAEAPSEAERERRAWLAGARIETMLETLELLDRRFGGAERYARHAGLTERDVGALRARLLA